MSADTRTIQAAVRNLVAGFDRVDPEVLYGVQQKLEAAVKAATYPRLIPSVELDEDEEPFTVLTCPHCLAKVKEDSSEYTTLTVIDIAYRETSMLADPDGEHEITGYYDHHGDYEALVYVHEGCRRPVSLPEGWREV